MLSCNTGTSDSGKAWHSTDHAPWSRPQLSSSPTGVGASSSLTRRARAGSPGAGYVTSYNCRGKPPKSWIVLGAGIAVTKVPGTYQWAETHSTALGRGTSSPILAQALVYSLTSRAFIGLPCPKKIAGMGLVISNHLIAMRYMSQRPLSKHRIIISLIPLQIFCHRFDLRGDDAGPQWTSATHQDSSASGQIRPAPFKALDVEEAQAGDPVDCAEPARDEIVDRLLVNLLIHLLPVGLKLRFGLLHYRLQVALARGRNDALEEHPIY